MIISFNGDHGSGKSTMAKNIAEALGFKRYYMGKIFRDLAKEKGLTLEDLHTHIVDNPEVDKMVDDYLVELAKKEDNFVIESRTAWYFIPNSLKIYLKIDDDEAAKRILGELQSHNERNEGKDLNTLEKVKESIIKRKKMDDERYMKFYGIDIRNKKDYDFVIDTTNLSIQESFEKVMEFIKTRINEKSDQKSSK